MTAELTWEGEGHRHALAVRNHPNSDVEILMPDLMEFGSETFGRGFGPEGGAHMNGLNALIKERPLAHLPCADTVKRC